MTIQGKRFVLTGRFSGFTQSEVEARLQALGAVVTSSVSGTTDIVIAGSRAGSTVAKAKKRGLPVLDADDLMAILEGAPLSEILGASGDDDTAHKPAGELSFPTVFDPPRDGNYQQFYESGELQKEGRYANGLPVGLWTGFYKNGQKKWEVTYEDGLRDGTAQGWFEDGTLKYEGQWSMDKQSNAWNWWHENGAYRSTYHYDEDGKKHGEYVWDGDDGQPRGRGEFWHDKRHGQWTWWSTKTHEKVIRGHFQGMLHGEDAAWFDGGQLAYQRNYDKSYRDGREVEFYPDGSPKLEANRMDRYPVGIHRSWDEEGKETVVHYVDGLAKELAEDEALMKKTAKKIAKASSSFKKTDALRDAAEYSGRAPFLIQMVRKGHFDIAADVDLWEIYAEGQTLLSTEEVIDLLKNAEVPDHGFHIPGWPEPLDKIVLHAYKKDPEPFEAIVEELPQAFKLGVAFVMARFGKDISSVIDDQAELFARKHFDHEFSTRLPWVNDDKEIETIDIRDGQILNENCQRFLELFTTRERFTRALLDCLLEKAQESSPRFWYPNFSWAIEAANLEEMSLLLKGSPDVDAVEKIFFDWRSDSAEDIATMALKPDGRGRIQQNVVAAAIVAFAEQEKPVDPRLIDAFELEVKSPSLRWVDEGIRKFETEDHKTDLAMIDRATSYADPTTSFGKSSLIFRAMEALPPEAQRKLIEEKLQAPYGSGPDAASFLYLVDDQSLWERCIEACMESKYERDAAIFGLGGLPASALPLLVDAHKRAGNKEKKTFFHQAILVMMARLSDIEEEWDPEFDMFIDFGFVKKRYDYDKFASLLMKIVYRLPRERAVAVLRRGLEKPSTFGRAFKLLASHPDQELTEFAFTQLLEREDSLSNDDQRSIGDGLKFMPEVRPWIKFMLRQGGGSHLTSQMEAAVGGRDKFAEIKEELENEGVQAAKELDAIDKLKLLAEKAGGKGQTLYLLRRLDEAPDNPGLNLIGGLPPGVGSDRWPRFNDEPMAHLFTLDLETMPALKAQYSSSRTISVFCHQPSYNEAWEAGNAQTAILFSTQEQVDADELELPEELPDSDPRWFEPVAIEVDPGIFFQPDSELYKKIYAAHARVLGEPIWLQSEEHWGRLILQFDEAFAHVNLGDMGVMYVFDDTAFWQCH